MTDEEYFKRSEVSNSTLTWLKDKLNDKPFVDPTDAFFFGSLLDAMVTEPHRIDFKNQTYDGNYVEQHFWNDAINCLNSLKNDPSISAIKDAEFQKVFIREMEFDYRGIKFTLGVRCKWDFFGTISGDLKSTAATSQKSFEAACEFFSYWRSRAWYMDISGTDLDLLVGVSKKNYKVFKKVIRRGDDLYKKGKKEYTELAFKFWILQHFIN